MISSVPALADAGGGGCPFADTVERQNRRLLERRGIKSAGGVRDVVLGEQQPLVPVEIFLAEIAQQRPEIVLQQVLLEQLLAQPHRHGLGEGREAFRRESEIGFKQPFELQERLVVEHHIIDVLKAGAALPQDEIDGVAGKAWIVLLAGEALLLGRRDDITILDQRRGAIMVKG